MRLLVFPGKKILMGQIFMIDNINIILILFLYKKLPEGIMGVASLVLGIVSLVFALIIPGLQIVAPIVGIIGIILGAIARKNLKAASQPTGMATAGLVMSIIGTILGVLMWLLCVACVGAMGALGTM